VSDVNGMILGGEHEDVVLIPKRIKDGEEMLSFFLICKHVTITLPCFCLTHSACHDRDSDSFRSTMYLSIVVEEETTYSYRTEV